MRGPVKALVVGATLMTAGLGAAVPAVAETAPITLITSDFACSNGVCEAGPGNAGVAFEAMLFGTGGPTYFGPECNPYLMSVVSGSLPPGLTLGEPICTRVISGTPTQAGTYTFTVHVQRQPTNLGQPGPSGTQQLTITIGAGGSDRLTLYSALLNLGCNSYPPLMQVLVSDANSGATYTVTTSTGRQVATFTGNSRAPGGVLKRFTVPTGAFPRGASVTVTDALGGSATILVRQRSGC